MPSNKHNPSVVFAVTNCISYDQRVLKMAQTVEELGADIIIIGRKMGSSEGEDHVPFRTIKFRMIFTRGFLFYKFFNIRLFFLLLFIKADIIVSNDLDTLPACWLASKIRAKTLVYDSHEYFTGVPELLERKFVRSVWEKIEKLIVPCLENVITVSDPIADIFYEKYQIKPVVIRNCSRSSAAVIPVSRMELGIDEERLLLVLQGGGINIHKGAEELVEAMKSLPDVHLLIIGSGDVIPYLKRMASENDLECRINFLPRMPWSEMMRFTKAADAGLSLERDTNINYRFSLPNKMFDYISAGIPVIAGELPEIAKVIAGNSCGILIPSITPAEIARAVTLLDGNRDLLMVLKQNSGDAFKELNWEKESEKVKELYINLLAEVK